MEDQGKRLFLAIALAFGVTIAWSYLFPPEAPPPEQAERADERAEPTERPRTAEPSLPRPSIAQDGAGADADALAPTPSAPRGEEQLYEFAFDTFRAVFTSYGASLKSWELQGDKYRQGEGEDARGLDLVTLQDETVLPFRIGFEGIDLLPAESEWRGERKSDTELEFTWSYTAEKDGEEVVLFDIVKSYRLYPEEYLVELIVSVENRNAGEQNLEMSLSLFGFQDPNASSGASWFAAIDQSWKTACMVDEDLEVATREDLEERPVSIRGELAWAGITHNYFLMAAAPKSETNARLGCRLSELSDRSGVLRADIVFPPFRVKAGDPRMVRSVVAYLGPKYLDKLEAIPRVIDFDPGFATSIELGWFGILAWPLLWLLRFFESLVGNWGVAIILLTVVVKSLLLPFTAKSMRSMKAMGRLKPKMEAIRKKYGDDQRRQQEEMMALYKANGVNPVAGCLPMLLQMPVWFALYRMLMTAGELYHAPLVPGWVDDLTASDPFYVLPILLVVMMFLQAKLSPTTADSAQQKLMMYGLPLTFGIFSFFLPSGLTLYILTNTMLTALHQFWMNRNDPVVVTEPKETKSASPTDVSSPSRPSSDERAAKVLPAGDSDASSVNRPRKSGGSKKRGKKPRKR